MRMAASMGPAPEPGHLRHGICPIIKISNFDYTNMFIIVLRSLPIISVTVIADDWFGLSVERE